MFAILFFLRCPLHSNRLPTRSHKALKLAHSILSNTLTHPLFPIHPSPPNPLQHTHLHNPLQSSPTRPPAHPTSRHKTIIDTCVKESVKRYIPPEFGLRSDDEGGFAARVPVVAMKKRIREYCQSVCKEKEGNGLSWTGVVCGAFMDA